MRPHNQRYTRHCRIYGILTTMSSWHSIIFLVTIFNVNSHKTTDGADKILYENNNFEDQNKLMTVEYRELNKRSTSFPRYSLIGHQIIDANELYDDLNKEIKKSDGIRHGNKRRNHFSNVTFRHGLGNGKMAASLMIGAHQGYGPRFDDFKSSDNISLIVEVGRTVHIDCKVSMLRDKTVSWVLRRTNEPPMLLTVGDHTYTGDRRFSVQFRYPGNWRLQISPIMKTDEGIYECQLSTHPPTVIRAHLRVEAPEVVIVDEFSSALKEQYYEIGSTLVLKCLVKGVSPRSAPVWWLHGTRPLHRDVLRGGIAVKTDASLPGYMESTLIVGRLSPVDSGNYTCTLPTHNSYTVLIHVLNEESLGELQQGLGLTDPSSIVYLLTSSISTVAIVLIVGSII